ncbi:MAG: transglycosylase domain-containing protein [Clostridiales bacterium]|nr:transglycosylase domain-containing protein [Clostridiales bacterium]
MKYFKRLIVLMLFISIVFVGRITLIGYINYSQVIHEIGLEDTIEKIQNSDDFISIEQVTDTFIKATVSVEDKRFYEHNGIDHISIARAMVVNIQAKSFKTGGSTITQQLAKNLFLTFDKTLERKATEFFLAKKIESLYSKDEILSLYINVINYGDDCIGISDATEHYYNKTPLELKENEAVLLAGLPQSPSNYSLTENYTKAIIRSERVINAMVNNDVINKSKGLEILALIKRENLWKHY